MIEVNLLIDIGLVIIFAAIGAIAARLFRQPLILGYIIAGVVIGPAVLGLIGDMSVIQTLAELGIAFLLFFIGLEFDISKIKKLGLSVSVIGIFEVALITIVGTLLACIFLDFTAALYIGFILAFSSTMIVVKLIIDKKEMDTLHGRIILGILLIQDVIVVIALPFLATAGATITVSYIFQIILGLVIMFLLVILLQKYILKRVFRVATDNQEFLFIFALAIAFVFMGISYIFGFSLAIGGFLGGLAVATRPYNFEIAGRIKSLKDFFAVLFFVSLGSLLTFDSMGMNAVWVIVIAIGVVLILKPVIFFFLLKAFKFSNRVSLLTSTSLAQVSEFSLIIAAQGLLAAHLQQSLFNAVIIVAIVTIVLTNYLIKYDNKIYGFFSNWLIPLERWTSKRDLERVQKEITGHTILFGADRMGDKIAQSFERKKNKLIIVDFNPEIIKRYLSKGYNCVYGDYSNEEILEVLHLEKASMIISTIPEVSDNLLVIDLIKSMNPKAILVLTARAYSEAATLYENGADFVVLPEALAGSKVSDFLKKFKSKQQFRNEGIIPFQKEKALRDKVTRKD